MAIHHNLDGKKVLVTAAAQGIGHAIARRLIEEGAIVYAADINTQGMEGALGRAAHCTALDVRDREAVFALSRKIPALDVLVNCAGFVHDGALLECTLQDWNFTLDLNVTSIFHTTQAFLPGMVAAKRGVIVNISSIAGAIKAIPKRLAYSVSKAAVSALTRSIALDFVQDGIRANSICPGTVDTPSLQRRLAATGDARAAYASFAARQPMNRLGQPDEIAEMAVYLAGDRSAFVTGQDFVIDGGWTM